MVPFKHASFSLQTAGTSIDQVGGEAATPLGQIGVSDGPTEILINKVGQSGVARSGSAPSATVVAFIVVIIIAIILITFMYYQSSSRQLFFNRQIELSVPRKETKLESTIFAISLVVFGAFSLEVLLVQRPYKGYQSLPDKTKSTGEPALLENNIDLYVILTNYAFLLLAMFSMVFLDSAFFAVAFGIAAIVTLLLWRPRPSFFVLAIAETVMLALFGLKFSQLNGTLTDFNILAMNQ